jgi:hypothetical protein
VGGGYADVSGDDLERLFALIRLDEEVKALDEETKDLNRRAVDILLSGALVRRTSRSR